MLLISRPVATPTSSVPLPSQSPVVPTAERIYLPRADVVRSLRLPPERVPPPTRVPRDRMSVGPPSAERTRGPLVLRREDDLTAVPEGTPQGKGVPVPSPRSALPAEEATVAD